MNGNNLRKNIIIVRDNGGEVVNYHRNKTRATSPKNTFFKKKKAAKAGGFVLGIAGLFNKKANQALDPALGRFIFVWFG